MLKKIKNYFVNLELDKEINSYRRIYETIEDEIEYGYKKFNVDIPQNILAKQVAITNIIRRVEKIKQNYNK